MNYKIRTLNRSSEKIFYNRHYFIITVPIFLLRNYVKNGITISKYLNFILIAQQ